MSILTLKDSYIPNLVSVVIPTYNQKLFVEETINSVLSQDFTNYEIIISDNGSTDGTQEILKNYQLKFPEKIRVVLNQDNTGLASNFNRGLSLVRGEYIAWLDGDDVMYPSRLTKQVTLLNANPEVAGCCHDAEVFKSPSNEVIGKFSVLSNGVNGVKEGTVKLWFDASYLTLPTTYMYRSKYIPDNGFDERLKYSNDLLFQIECFQDNKCLVIDEVLGRYRRHNDNVTGNFDMREKGIEETLIVMAIVEARYPKLLKYVKSRRIVLYYASAIKCYKGNNFSGGNKYLKQIFLLGNFLKPIIFYFSINIFGKYIIEQTSLIPYQRSKIFNFLSKLMKRL